MILHPDSAAGAATKPIGTGPYKLDSWAKGTSITLVSAEQQGDVSRMASRLDLADEFQEEGMKVAPPRMVFSGSKGGRRSGLRKPTRRR